MVEGEDVGVVNFGLNGLLDLCLGGVYCVEFLDVEVVFVDVGVELWIEDWVG